MREAAERVESSTRASAARRAWQRSHEASVACPTPPSPARALASVPTPCVTAHREAARRRRPPGQSSRTAPVGGACVGDPWPPWRCFRRPVGREGRTADGPVSREGCLCEPRAEEPAAQGIGQGCTALLPDVVLEDLQSFRGPPSPHCPPWGVRTVAAMDARPPLTAIIELNRLQPRRWRGLSAAPAQGSRRRDGHVGRQAVVVAPLGAALCAHLGLPSAIVAWRREAAGGRSRRGAHRRAYRDPDEACPEVIVGCERTYGMIGMRTRKPARISSESMGGIHAWLHTALAKKGMRTYHLHANGAFGARPGQVSE